MTANLIRRAGALVGLAAATWIALALVLYLLFYGTVVDVYQKVARSVMQVECGRVVEGPLLYTLAPGECRFASPEFDTRITADADGFRNAGEHLGSGPLEVAVLGDSHAIGWGVGQAEKLSSLLARDPRFSVRDLAMSSYGTARELIALKAHAGDAGVVVIQYCDNDRSENARFLADPVGFVAGSAERARTYGADIALMKQASAASATSRGLLRATLGALAATWRLLWLPPAGRRETPPAVLAEEARLFAGVLAHFKAELAGKTVLVWDSFPRTPRRGFAAAFGSALASAGLGHVAVMDLSGALSQRDYFHIDEHMRARGHAKVAARVLAELDRPGRLPVPAR